MLLRQFEFLQASKCFGLLEEALTALEKLELARPGLGWYEATRHTFASQWVLSGGSIEKLKEMLGHYSVVVTGRYAHLLAPISCGRANSGEPTDQPRSIGIRTPP